jgi:16S rRNA (uracil1498-N3)-methyltransferase
MALKAVYLPEPQIHDKQIRITDEEHRHLAVARAEIGEIIEIFDGCGKVSNARVVAVGRRETLVEIEASREVARPKHEIILAMALVRLAAFELALEKAVEIGVTRIVPFLAARSNVTLTGRGDRWTRIIVEAAKQSKRYHLPALEEYKPFKQVLEREAPSKIIFAEHDGGPLQSALSDSPVLYLVGPEGGWTDQEVAVAISTGFAPVSLGAGILRAETAAIVGGALIGYELGKRDADGVGSLTER